MRWLLLVALAAVVALLGWFVASERERAGRERQALTETEKRRAPAPAPAENADATGPERGAEPETALLEGTVTGRYGAIWGVRVAALDAGSERVLAETYTDSDGRYAIELPPGSVVDVLVEPAGETGLPPQRREGVVVAAVVDVVLEPRVSAAGVLRREGSKQYDRVYLMAVPEARCEESKYPWELSAAARVTVALYTEETPFEFTGLAAGAYRLVLDADRWMLRERVRFTANARDIKAVAVPAFGLRLRVEDAALAIPVGRFRVLVQFDAKTTRRWEGRSGLLRCRVAHPMPAAWKPASGTDESFLEVTAPGYLPERLPLGHRGLVRLKPTRDLNVFLRIRYEDGEDCAEPLRADVRNDDVAPFAVGFERALDGRRRASLPPGPWALRVWRKEVLLAERHWVALEVPFDGEVEREITVKRTASLILRGEPRQSVWIARVHEDETESGRLLLTLQKAEQEWRLLPGRYRVGRGFGGAFGSDIEFASGERIHVDVPAEGR